MHRVKFTTTSTGSTLTLSVPTGFAGASFPGDTSTTMIDTSYVYYTLVAENGTDWEVGVGTISGGVLTRQDFPFNSSGGAGGPGFYYNISLTAGTHTVFITRDHYNAHILLGRYKNTTGVSVGAASNTTSLGTLTTDVDGLQYAQSTGGTVAAIIADPASEVLYARGFRIHFEGKCSTAADAAGDQFGIQVQLNGSGDYIAGAWAPLRGAETTVSLTTPIIDMKPPFPDSSTKMLQSGSGVTYTIFNENATTAITVMPYITIEWYL